MLSMGGQTPETAVRLRLREMAGLGAALRESLLSARDSLPVSPREDVMLLGEEDADFPTEVRRTIDCVVVDLLEPLIQALQVAAEYQPGGELPSPLETGWDKEGDMAMKIPPDVRREVERITEALRAGVARSPLSHAQIEQALAVPEGYLDALLSGRAELSVEHLFGVLSVTGADLWECLLLQSSAKERDQVLGRAE